MKEIYLSRGKTAIVDDCDYEYLNQWKWHYSGGYAVRNAKLDAREKSSSIHASFGNGASIWNENRPCKP